MDIVRCGFMNFKLVLFFAATLSAQIPRIDDSGHCSAPRSLTVAQWRSQSFVLLEKARMFREFGYELYTSRLLDKDKSPPDVSIETSQHRLLYKPFAGHSVRCTSVVKEKSGEYLCAFVTDTLNRTVWARTRKGVIEGIAWYDDLSAAHQCWLGRTIYSRRKILSVYDTSASNFTNIIVSILEPLRVVEVRWGVVPLPPKPIWIVVERPNKSRGFIPIVYSNTNIMLDKQTAVKPWSDDILEGDPKVIYKWDGMVWEAIDKHSIFNGMQKEQVRLSWGDPLSVVIPKTKSTLPSEQWVFSGNTLVFVKDSLAEVR